MFKRGIAKPLKRGKVKLLGFVALTGLASSAFAAGESTIFGKPVSIDTTPVTTMAGIVVAAIAGIWAIKKVIALANKS